MCISLHIFTVLPVLMWISCKQQHSRDDFRSGPPVKAIEFPDIWATRDQHALRGGWSWAMVFPYGWWTKTFWTDASEYVVQMYKHIFHVCTGSIGLFCFDVPICLIFKCLWRHRHVSIFYQEKQYIHINISYVSYARNMWKNEYLNLHVPLTTLDTCMGSPWVQDLQHLRAGP